MKSAFLWKMSWDEAGRCGVKVCAVQIASGFTDLWDEINGDQTLLNFSFNCAMQGDSSVSWCSSYTYTISVLHLPSRTRGDGEYIFVFMPYMPGIWNEHTQSRPDSRLSLHVWFFFLSYSSLLHFPKAVPGSLMCLPVWKSFPFLLFLSFFLLFSNPQSCCEVSLRSWKVLFKPQVFAIFTFQLQDEYRWDKAWCGKAFDKTSEGLGARPVSSFCSFPITRFLAWMLKRHRIKCKLRVAVFHGTSVGLKLLLCFIFLKIRNMCILSCVIRAAVLCSTTVLYAGKQCLENAAQSKIRWWGLCDFHVLILMRCVISSPWNTSFYPCASFRNVWNSVIWEEVKGGFFWCKAFMSKMYWL